MLFIIVVGGFPFQNASIDDDLYSKLCNPGTSKEYWQKITKKKVSKNFKSLISQLLHSDPKQRIKLGSIKDHPWCVAGLGKKHAAPLRDAEDLTSMHDKTLHEGGLKNTI
jgi:serine/threonine protein kinase